MTFDKHDGEITSKLPDTPNYVPLVYDTTSLQSSLQPSGFCKRCLVMILCSVQRPITRNLPLRTIRRVPALSAKQETGGGPAPIAGRNITAAYCLARVCVPAIPPSRIMALSWLTWLANVP